jgi:putative mRNA 3-end processing factor
MTCAYITANHRLARNNDPMPSNDLLLPDDRGLFCPAGGFHVDPWRPCPIAIITHAHSDHARAGSDEYWCSHEGAGLLAARLPAGATIRTLGFGERRRFGDAVVSLHPAGHVRGSAQVRVERDADIWVVSGDYKRQPDPTCTPFEVVPCATFITEATFAIPVYRWDPPRDVITDIARWWKSNSDAGRASVLFCYSLGKT